MPENTTLDMNTLPEHVDDLQYCVLDYSSSSDVDFQFIPLVFVESFPRPSADLRIGKFNLQIPLDWSILIAEKDLGLIEVIEVKHLNGRDFTAFALNPIAGYLPSFPEITIENIYPDITWHVPHLKNGHILGIPLEDKHNPLCVWVVKDSNRIPESLDITKIMA